MPNPLLLQLKVGVKLAGKAGVLGGVIFSQGTLKTNEIFGCIIMFIAIIVAQIPELIQNKKDK